MSRFEYSNSFSTKVSRASCEDAAEMALAQGGCRTIESRRPGKDGEVEYFGTVGMGWVLRLIGGLIAPATMFPVRLTISIVDHGAAREVTAVAAEDFGFGTLFGIEKKMRLRCDDLAAQMSRDLARRLEQLAA